MKRPRIYFNGGLTRTLSITSTVTQHPDSTSPVVINPYKLNLSEYTEVPVTENVFEFRNVTANPLHPVLIAAPDSLLEVLLPEIVPAHATAQGRILLTFAGIDTSFQKSITVAFDDEELTRFTIPVTRVIRYTPASSQP